ncbi:MAG: thioesterase [Brevinematales bacterium]|nr:thioesterase [Brevinematales bacterium]
MGYIFEKEYEVRYYETDFKGKLLLSRLFNYFDDCAIKQSEAIGVGLNFLTQLGASWFLYQWDISIKELPQYGDIVTVKTEPLEFCRFYGTRRFELFLNKNKIIEAFSVWIFLDIAKKKPKRIPSELSKKYGVEKESEQIKHIEIQYQEDFTITRSEQATLINLDTNNHINQAVYIDWVLNSIPIDFIKSNKPDKLKVIYKKETKLDEKVEIFSHIKNNQSFHKIFSPTQNCDLCNVEIYWLPI